jgi:hypothetical protein
MAALMLPVGGKPPQQQDAGHRYTRAGAPAYEQRAASGGLRATDLRDARKHGLVPSVTTVLGVLAKPALTNWLVDQGVMAALTLPRIEGETETAFLARIKEDSKAQAKAAAEEGTRIHDALECAFKGDHYPHFYQPHIDAVREELARLFPGVDDWIAEASFAHESGFGGKVDLHSPSTGIVADYKGKDGDFSDGKKLAYDQHYQLAAYNRGLLLPPSLCANIFVSRTHPGRVASHVWKREEVDHGWEVFAGALQVWKLLKKFDGSFDPTSNRIAA